MAMLRQSNGTAHLPTESGPRPADAPSVPTGNLESPTAGPPERGRVGKGTEGQRLCNKEIPLQDQLLNYVLSDIRIIWNRK